MSEVTTYSTEPQLLLKIIIYLENYIVLSTQTCKLQMADPKKGIHPLAIISDTRNNKILILDFKAFKEILMSYF